MNKRDFGYAAYVSVTLKQIKHASQSFSASILVRAICDMTDIKTAGDLRVTGICRL